MANSNQILPFAIAAGANVVSPAVYAAMTERQTGFQSGTASSQKVNTAIRQASFIAAAIAQFTADYGIANVNDDGNIAAFETNFAAAVTASVNASSTPGLVRYGVDTGAVNALVVPAVSLLFDGLILLITPAHANNGPTSCNVGFGATPVVLNDGATALVGGEIQTSVRILLVYDATLGKFRLINPHLIAGTPFGNDTGTVNALVATISPAPVALQAGLNVTVGALNGNTGAATLNLNGLGVKSIVFAKTGTPLFGNDFQAGALLQLTYDGTYWRWSGTRARAFNSGTSASTSSSIALTSSAVGSALLLNASSGIQTVTLPNHASLVAGDPVTVAKTTGGTGVINAYGSASVIDSGSGLVSSVTINLGESAEFVWSGSVWVPIGSLMFRQAQLTSKQSLSGNGYQVLPGGVIMQWGSFSGTTGTTGVSGVYESGSISITWPLAFPTALLQAVGGCGTDVAGQGMQEQAWFTSVSRTGGTALVACRQASAALSGSYIVFGY